MKRVTATLMAFIMALCWLPVTASAATPQDMKNNYFYPEMQKPEKPYIQFEHDPVHWDTVTAWFDLDEDLLYLIDDAREDTAALYDRYNLQDCFVHFQFDCNVDNTGWQADADWDTFSYDYDKFSPFEPEYSNYTLYDIDKKTISQTLLYSFEAGETSVFNGKIIKNGDATNLDMANHNYAFRYRYVLCTYDKENNEDTFFSPWSDEASIGKNASQQELKRPTSLEAVTIGGSCLAEGTQQEPENHFYIDIYNIPQSVFDAVKYFNIYENPENRTDLVMYQAQYRVNGGSWTELPFLYATSIDGSTRDQGQLPVTLMEGDKVEIRLRVKAGPKKEVVSPWSNIAEFTAPVTDYNYTPPIVPAPAPITDLEGDATEEQVDSFITNLNTDGDPKGSSFWRFPAKQGKVTKSSVKLTWNKVNSAAYYVVYGNKCGKGNRYQRLGSTKNLSYVKKKLAKGTYYKFLVSAFNKNGKHIATSRTMHIATAGGKFCNFSKVTTKAKKNKVALASKGKTFKLGAKAVKASAALKANTHRKIRFESSDKKIATVDAKGTIKAVKKGTCYVYAYAQNGVYQKITVTVKK